MVLHGEEINIRQMIESNRTLIGKIYSEDSRKISNRTGFDLLLVGDAGYGETGFLSMERIIGYFKEYFAEGAIFYDLGCGTGKIVYHVGIGYPVKKSCGIEFSKERCETAARIAKKYGIASDRISIVNKNILNCDISDATVIYMDNTLFPKHITEKIYDMVPDGCLVISRARISKRIPTTNDIQSDISNKVGYSIMSEYGGSSLFMMIRKR